MAIRNPFYRKARKSHEIEFTPSFIPLELVNAYISDGLNANQRKFLELYLSVPELQAIINYKARVFSGMRIKAVDSNGKEKDIPQINQFAQPNPLQNFKEFSTQYYVLRAIFGNEFIHPVFASDKKKVKAYWNLPPVSAEVIPVDSQLIPFNMTEIEELIKGYKFLYNGQEIKYGADEIIHFNDNQVHFDRNKILLGDSKLRPLVQACENIKNAYEARGILILNAALGILSNETADADGTVDMDPKEKERLQKAYKEEYGLSKRKWSFITTNAKLKWQSMATDVQKLQLHKEVEDDFQTIANAHNFPPEILQPKSGNSLNQQNKDGALRQLYQEAIIPEADEWLQGFANWMELDFVLKSDWSHISVLQLDKERASKSINWAATGLVKAKDGNLIVEADAQETFKKFLP